MAGGLRWYDSKRDRLVTASPNLLMVWEGQKPVTPVSGPWELPEVPKSVDDLIAAYNVWVEQGEPK